MECEKGNGSRSIEKELRVVGNRKDRRKQTLQGWENAGIYE